MGFVLQPRRAVLGAFGLLVVIVVVSISATPVQAADRSALIAKAFASVGKRTGTAPGSEYRAPKGSTKVADRDVRRFCKAAKKGDADAQFDLGYLYAVGRGVKRNEGLAAAWFQWSILSQ